MKKPTKDDLERIRADLREMMEYIADLDNKRNLFYQETSLYFHLTEALDELEFALLYIDDFANANKLVSETDD